MIAMLKKLEILSAEIDGESQVNMILQSMHVAPSISLD
jgi:hypothetical protein